MAKVIAQILAFIKQQWHDFISLPKVFYSGIRAKLALFTGSLIALTILILSFIYVRQQTQILTDSYEREAAISRRYISSLVLELDNISQSLIRIEEFRDRVRKQTEALKKYKTTKTTKEENKVSLFGFKTSLFGVLGKKTVRKSLATYYSEYLSKTDIDTLEKNIRSQLRHSGDQVISDFDFSRLQSQAKKFVETDREAAILRKHVAEMKEASENPDHTEITAVEEELRKKSIEARGYRTHLDASIAALLANSKKKKIKDLGLDTSRFRIQSFPPSGIVHGEITETTLDTKIFDPESSINQVALDGPLEDGLKSAFTVLTETVGVTGEVPPTSFQQNGLELQALYSPHFRNPASTERARLVDEVRKDPGPWRQFVGSIQDIQQELSKIPPALEARLKLLREKKPPVPPHKDKEFKIQYEKYAALIRKRDLAFTAFRKNLRLNEEEEHQVDAMETLRDSALEDQVLLRFKPDGSDYERYIHSDSGKEYFKKRWAALRSWIYSGESETPPAKLKASFPDGIIGNSRTEAEQILWKLDTTPLISDETDDLATIVLSSNFSGIIRTLVDRTEGLKEIHQNRNRAVVSAFGICGFSIFLAVFISGFVVQKIKRIIRGAEEVGKGYLNVEFEPGGNDEFGNLSVALNQMVTGLRDRDKIKGILGSMVDPVVIIEAMKDLAALKRGMEKRVTAFFSDVAGFSAISEKLSSVELANLLNEYLSQMTYILKEHDGVLDKYIGDAIVGIYNAPVDVENHTLKAVKASLKMIERLEDLKKGWNKDRKYIQEARDMKIRIGLNVGLAKVGFMGTDALASYTMMGDTVNLAARLEAAGKDYGVSILASDAVYAEVKDQIFTRKLDLVRVKGKNDPVILYEIISDMQSASPKIREKTRHYEEGLALYLDRKWDNAIKKFKDAEAAGDGPDKAVQLLIERCKEYKATPPPISWDGVYTRDHK
ncbi:adenylate/guanylate cyclase domain-containing protein [Leptospira perolatii]|uniref:Adenylate/guanylate cyclase domain-containing protein n=1 Tax=Leptospira perolatii TaxID=2023191 RepID=A0A2M9ZPY3_9LEPT|nr:adenylate/guanylate cyclase domain-containing protein [Leptospira perolatii]PJZ70909.1 adenylate/guanylate cyclase domain-containing protein [Leptospira perolatii]PJZ74031.1 adenylate/guanylate cyclase domain-containing protein [Leptospira perolatii]